MICRLALVSSAVVSAYNMGPAAAAQQAQPNVRSFPAVAAPREAQEGCQCSKPDRLSPGADPDPQRAWPVFLHVEQCT